MAQDVIEEFRQNAGAVGDVMEGRPLLLLRHVGARTGTHRVCPLMYQAVEGGYAIFASKGGARSNPHWFYNLRSRPDTEVELGTDIIAVHAREAHGKEYERIWTEWKLDWPQFADYERKTSRDIIPVVILERR